ncbi:class I adenylate-forming enzyme family protein [Lacisediminimonas profundi]|uniref:class I adenylate-forming enzyme family protein n=1 Tax=Lacisediminimonas profundi TaxID=2603856 RepID=UPI00124B5811|nr:class I adenylate-forming enzyme family protein [Lacisediminimonas profundi]
MSQRWNNIGELSDPGEQPDRPAIIDLRDRDKPRTYTYAEFDGYCGGVSHALVAAGLKRGARVAIASLNRAEFLFAYFGIQRAGMVVVPINIKLPKDRIDYILDDAAIEFAFVDGASRVQLDGRVPVIDFDGDDDQGFSSRVKPARFDTVKVGEQEIGQIIYTSGSTGNPKGVLLPHSGQLWVVSRTALPATPEPERYLLAQPLFHMNGLILAKRTFASRGTLVILPSFDVSTYVDTLERYQINALSAIPTMFARIFRNPELLEKRDLSSLRRVSLASAPMTLALWERIKAALPGVRLTHGYGSTEAGAGNFGPHPDGRPSPPLSVGYATPETEIRLVDGPDENEGVLVSRNPAMFTGYQNLPEKTAEVLQDGWYYSGDIMRRDEDGFYFFVGRADDMFVCSGENIHPGEVEKMLEKHPQVRQACVVPLSDEERGQMPVAFLVPKPGTQINFEDIKAFALANGPAYHYPRRVQVVDELPLAGTAKVDRNLLKNRARELETTAAWTSGNAANS